MPKTADFVVDPLMKDPDRERIGGRGPGDDSE